MSFRLILIMTLFLHRMCCNCKIQIDNQILFYCVLVAMSSYRRAFDEFSFSKIVLILILNVILKNGVWKRSFGGITAIAICSVNFEKACIKWDRASGDQARYHT